MNYRSISMYDEYDYYDYDEYDMTPAWSINPSGKCQWCNKRMSSDKLNDISPNDNHSEHRMQGRDNPEFLVCDDCLDKMEEDE